MQLKNILFLFKFNQHKKKEEAFYNIKQFAFYKKKQIQEEKKDEKRKRK